MFQGDVALAITGQSAEKENARLRCSKSTLYSDFICRLNMNIKMHMYTRALTECPCLVFS
jgi:hypothetical protein